jgi:hypothetical protein
MKNQFTEKLEQLILSVFPESFVSVEVMKIIGDPFCRVSFLLAKDENECVNRISENDHVKHFITIYGVNEDLTMKDKLEVTCNYGSFYVKPPVGSYLALGRIKTGWRNFTANEDKTIEKIHNYFINLKKILVENLDEMTDETKALMIKKVYV